MSDASLLLYAPSDDVGSAILADSELLAIQKSQDYANDLAQGIEKPAAQSTGGEGVNAARTAPSGQSYPEKSTLDRAVAGPLVGGTVESFKELARFVQWAVPFSDRFPDIAAQVEQMERVRAAQGVGSDPTQENLGQSLLRGITAFAAPFGLASKASKAAGLTKAPRRLATMGAASAVGTDPRESGLLPAAWDAAVPYLFSEGSPYSRAVGEFLSARPEDTEAALRLKKFLDGMFLQAGFDAGHALTKWGVKLGVQLAKGLKETLESHAPGPKQVSVSPEGIHVTTPEQAALATPQGGNPELRRMAVDYRASRGLPAVDMAVTRSIDPEASKRIADAYERLTHAPGDPRVQRAYTSFKSETYEQYRALERQGYRFEPWDKPGQPYQSSAEVLADVRENRHLYYFTGGDLPPGHPLLEVMPNGMTANECFRCVHDIFGHAQNGNQFGAQGEFRAWADHGSMYSSEAAEAMTTETLGQNSWVNFGAHLRDESGAVPGKGQPGFTPPQERPFAEQKANVLESERLLTQGPDFTGAARELAGGGFSLSPSGGLMKAKEGYAVSVFPERSRSIPGTASKEQLAEFHAANRDLLDADPELLIGGWMDEGKSVLDLSRITQDRREAMRLGREHKQKAVYDFSTGESLPVEGEWAEAVVRAGDEALARIKETWADIGDPSKVNEVSAAFAAGGSLASDAAIYGAAQIIRGLRGVKPWADHMIQAFGEGVRPYLEKLRQAAEARVRAYVRAGFNHAQVARELLKFYHEGESGLGWYTKTREEIESIFGREDGRLVLGFLAATSPNSTVKSNVALAMRAYEQFKLTGKINPTEVGNELAKRTTLEGKGFEGFLGAVVKNLERVTRGEELSGNKVRNFYAALMGDENAVVIDRWMIRALWPSKFKDIEAGTLTSGAFPSDSQYAFMADYIRSRARELGVTPRDLQAAVWLGIKRLRGSRSDVADPFEKVIKDHLDRKASSQLPAWVTEE